jgi:triacylglycerol lipase
MRKKAVSREETVVLIHGLTRTPRSMLGAGLWFRRAGYRVAYVGYPSTKISVEEAVRDHVAPTLEKIASRPGAGTLHFVTHSLGGIVFRAWAMQRPEGFPLGRSVLLAPPNNGCEIVDHVREWAVAKKIMGPVLQELGTKKNSTPKRLGTAPPETAVIMGDQANIPFFKKWLGSGSDGVVTIEGGRIPGLKDFAIMPSGHTWIMWRPWILKAAEHFIREGRFPKEE